MNKFNRYFVFVMLAFIVLSTVNCAKKSSSSKASRSAIDTAMPDTTTTTTTTTTETGNTNNITNLASLETTCQGRCGAGKVEYNGYCLPTKIYNCGSCYGFAYATDGKPYCYLSSAYPK